MSRILRVIILCVLVTACADDANTTIPPTPSISATSSSMPASTTVPPNSTVPRLDDIELELTMITGEFSTLPVFITGRADDQRLFVVEKAGLIWSINHDGSNRTLVLDMRRRVVRTGYEQGLLGLVFHPVDPTRMFIFYTEADEGTSVIDEHRFAIDAETPDPTPVHTLFTLPQPTIFHHAGMMEFGPDGYLYVSLGDGGGDPPASQDPHSLYGKLIRLDVDEGYPYTIPPDNPFADGVDGAPEVWALGLRNPWRFSFDGDQIWIADVGLNSREEINLLDHGIVAPDFGWPTLEGDKCLLGPADVCASNDFIEPIHQLLHEDGACAIIGGYVYRGSEYPELDGTYIFSDRCSRELMGIRLLDGEVAEFKVFDVEGPQLTSFGIDSEGELYITADDGVCRISVSR